MTRLNRFFLPALGLLNIVLLLARLPRPDPHVPGKLRIGLVFDVGGRGDKSFNDLAHWALERARQDLGVETETIEPGESSDREGGLRLLAAKGLDLVVGAGFLFSDDMYAVAQQYPKVHFACIDYAKLDASGIVNPPPNMVALKFREEEGSYLVGAIAALVTETQVVSFVGGMASPHIRRFEIGYREGVRAACPVCKVLVGYAGLGAEAFKNPSRGKELALAQIAHGSDVIFHASGSTGLGVFEAVRETGRLAIGVDADQADEAPGHVLTSMLKRADGVVYQLISELVRGHWRGGVVSLGLKDHALDYVYDAKNSALLGPQARAVAERLRADIMSGRVKVPLE